MDSETLITLTADIVAAHVSNNSVGTDDLSTLIQNVYGALAATGQPAQAAPEELTPSVSIRSSVKPDTITCLECGTRHKMLKRHLGSVHGLTPAEYRTRWGLSGDYPMVAPNYAEIRRQLAVKIGLGRKSTGRKRAGNGRSKRAPARA